MKSTEVDTDGTVRCPVCRATSFTSKRTGKGKLAFGILATKRLRCDGCGEHLVPGGPPKKMAADGLPGWNESMTFAQMKEKRRLRK
jgi:hypothetical protein